MIRILITEDSDVMAMLLRAILAKEREFEVVGHARNGEEAVALAQKLKPDLITMDIRMPVMDGFEATRQIMSSHPVPIVVVSSSVDDEELRITFRAIEEGALAVLEKPAGPAHPEFEKRRRELVETIRAMAEVKVVRRWKRDRPAAPPAPAAAPPLPAARAFELLAIGCSTGGPQTLQTILGELPAAFPLPILVVQHIARGFVGGLATWLGSVTRLKMEVAADGAPLRPGTVYFAPDDHHLGVERGAAGLICRLRRGEPVDRHLPSATALFEAVADCCGRRAVGLLLTGMGEDGARGLLRMRQAGAHTVVQDQASAVVYGMPGAAVALGAAEQVVNLGEIAPYLAALVRAGR